LDAWSGCLIDLSCSRVTVSHGDHVAGLALLSLPSFSSFSFSVASNAGLLDAPVGACFDESQGSKPYKVVTAPTEMRQQGKGWCHSG